MNKRLSGLLIVLIWVLASMSCQTGGTDSAAALKFGISFPEELSSEALDGRMLLLISNDDSREPRLQIQNRGKDSQLVFGLTVDKLKPGEKAVIDTGADGYPLKSIADIPAGEYWVQAVLNRYETFNRADGHVVKLPPDKGEGQKWNIKPGNLYSTPQKLRIDPRSNKQISLSLDNEIAPFPEPEDTKYIRHIKIQSKLLTEFWGRPMYLGAIILLPHGFDEHPEARYPLMVYHGHHHRMFYTPVMFRETPPEPGHSSADRSDGAGYRQLNEEMAYKFYQDWTGPDFPRMIIVTIQHANPYFDDSYAVNTENLGPYGDAITYELIPYIEKTYRGIGEGWARVVYGGSTGGWESLAVQIKYPDEYNGTWTFCPDPIDFRAFTVVNIYEDDNLYFLKGPWKRTPRAGTRNWLGHVGTTLQEINQAENVIGPNCRSGDQWAIWQAVFGPVGDDGYPKPLWDPESGKIDKSVAEYWRENYDLGYILRRDWDKIGHKLKGKLHIYCGDMDNYYLGNAVYLVEEFLESTTDPYYDGFVDYGDRREHCWTGDHDTPNSVGRLTINQRFAPEMMKRMLESAPPGADITSWRY